MLLAALLATTAPTIFALPAEAQPRLAPCRNRWTLQVAGSGSARIRPLGDEPPAQQIKAVLNRTPDGCVVPIVVRAEVGQPGR